MSDGNHEMELAVESHKTAYEQVIDAVARANQLTYDFGIDQFLRPLSAYFPDASEPVEALLSISHIYGWPIEEVASVMLDVENQHHPVMVTDKQFEAIDEPLGVHISPFVSQSAEQSFQVRFGNATTTTNITDRPLPDNWQAAERSTDAWLRRAELAEDITLYFAHGAERVMQDRSPTHLFEAGVLLKPYWDYAENCTAMARLEAGAQEVRDMRNDEFEVLGKYLREPLDISTLLSDESPVDEAKLRRARLFINYTVLRAKRDIDDFGYTPEQHRQHQDESDEARRQVKLITGWVKNEVRRDANHRLNS